MNTLYLLQGVWKFFNSKFKEFCDIMVNDLRTQILFHLYKPMQNIESNNIF